MAWQQISVVTSEASAPILSDYFSDMGAVSVTYMDAEDVPVYEPGVGETKIWPKTQVVALYEMSTNLTDIESRTRAQFQSDELNDWEYLIVEDQQWERAWLQYYSPMKFAEKLWVCPTGQEQLEPDTVCLTLDPGLAFGTGTHPTTALCLEWLASHDIKGKTVIDYGCGSGILAIAALLLGADKAYCVDIDPQALTATEYNADKNGIRERIELFLPEEFAKQNAQADIVLANILAQPLIAMSELLTSLVNVEGQLVMSGILAEQSDSVAAAYRSKMLIDDFAQKEDWVRLAGRHG